MYKKLSSILLLIVIFFIGNFSAYHTALAVGILTATNVQPASLVAGATSQVTVSFTTTGVIPPGGKVKVIFGSGFNVIGASGGTCSSTFLGDTGF